MAMFSFLCPTFKKFASYSLILTLKKVDISNTTLASSAPKGNTKFVFLIVPIFIQTK